MPICAAAETDDDLWHSAQRLRPPRKIPLVTSSIVNQPKIAAQQRNFALQAREKCNSRTWIKVTIFVRCKSNLHLAALTFFEKKL